MKAGDPSERDRLIDLLIHDLRGPLSVVSTSVANLLRKTDRYGPLTDRQRRTLERIRRNTHKAQTLIREMLEISSSQEGLFRKDRFSVEAALREALLDVLEVTASSTADRIKPARDIEEAGDILEEDGIFIDLRGKYAKVPFQHDREKIEQILRNLLSNALKYRRKRVVVSISGESDLLVSVEDDGMGIAPVDLESVFDRFARLKDSRRPEVAGLGLGLAGVKALVESMQGEILLTSRPEFGSCFTVRIPPLTSHKPKGDTTMASILSGKRILAVDDEPDVLMVLEEEIKDACPTCHLDKSTSHEEAAEKLRSRPYDLVILDIMGVGGFELLREAVSRQLRVVMLTAHALSPGALKRSIELGARAYLPKEELGEIIPFLEDVLTYENVPGWKRLFKKLGGFFSTRFGPDWQRAEWEFWNEFNKKLDSDQLPWWEKGP